MKAEALKGHLDGLLLAVLEPAPLHGYAVLQELHVRSVGAVDLATGTIYPALHRLEGTGFVRSEWVRHNGRRRRVYRLTKAGRQALTEKRQDWTEFVRALSGILSHHQVEANMPEADEQDVLESYLTEIARRLPGSRRGRRRRAARRAVGSRSGGSPPWRPFPWRPCVTPRSSSARPSRSP